MEVLKSIARTFTCAEKPLAAVPVKGPEKLLAAVPV